jgi:DNA polymerase-3 subunit delta'
MTRCAWDDIVGQSRVADFLRASVEGDRSVHAYMFVGSPGAGKATAARAFACALLCSDNGCGACGACQRVRRGSHPDVHVVRPEGAASYLIEQVRDLTRDANLAPIEGPKKIYIVGDADLFNDASANAFLKTLEEPPDDVVFILMAHAYDAVMPTIASRCQIVRFRRIPPSTAASLLRSQTGATEAEATAALAAAGGVIARARDFLDSSARRAARDEILRGLNGVNVMDDLDVLDVVKSLLVAVKAPLEDAKALQAVELESQSEFMGRSQIKALEERHKRELTAREREGVLEVLNVAESWLRDCLAISQGVPDLVANADVSDAMAAVGAALTPGAAARALSAVTVARKRISYNVSPQLAIEAMLFDIREVLCCPR